MSAIHQDRAHLLVAKQVFFPAAAIFAAAQPWLLLASLTTDIGLQVDFAMHAKGLLFGFVGALIAGYLLGKVTRQRLYCVLILWLAGRFSELAYPANLLTNLLHGAFGLVLMGMIAPKFLVAKKWTNRAIAPLIAVIGAFPLLYWLIQISAVDFYLPLNSLVFILAILMFFMGGRVITPLATKAFAVCGEKIPHRVQPKIEAATMLLLFASVLIRVLTPFYWVSALSAIIAAMLILVRLYRWQVMKVCWSERPILGLTAGYLWLALGLLFYSGSSFFGWPIAASIHIITIGALGSLSATIMLLGATKKESSHNWMLTTIIALLTIAVIARVVVAFIPSTQTVLLTITAMAWSVSFLMVAGELLAPRS